MTTGRGGSRGAAGFAGSRAARRGICAARRSHAAAARAAAARADATVTDRAGRALRRTSRGRIGAAAGRWPLPVCHRLCPLGIGRAAHGTGGTAAARIIGAMRTSCNPAQRKRQTYSRQGKPARSPPNADTAPTLCATLPPAATFTFICLCRQHITSPFYSARFLHTSTRLSARPTSALQHTCKNA